MNASLAEKLRELRKSKNVSQEKFASYLNVSSQAVSKWENGVTSPDISLLPFISRFFGITVDELLQVEKIDEIGYIYECSEKAKELSKAGKHGEAISLLTEAQRKLPNNILAKSELMNAYSQADRVKYQNEIIELGTEIYNTPSCPDSYEGYLKGKAIYDTALTYSQSGNSEKALEWANKEHPLMHSQEFLYMYIRNDEEWLTTMFSFTNLRYLEKLYHMAMRLTQCDVKLYGDDYVQRVTKAVIDVFNAVFPDDNIPFEHLEYLCKLHHSVAANEHVLGNDENTVREHLTLAARYALKTTAVKPHRPVSPLVCGVEIPEAPSDILRTVRGLKEELTWQCFDAYRERAWFRELLERLDSALQ